MIFRRAVACALFLSILSGVTAIAPPGDRYLNMKARVLDIVFPSEVAPKPYLLKMILRFGDSDTQLVVVESQDEDKYWVRRCEIASYSLADIGKGQLSQLISKMVAENPNVQAQEIAAKLKINVSHSFVAPEVLNHALDELKAVMISPILADRVAVDQYSEYEYWYDNWQESVHYTITSPFENAPQDKLGQWMLRFRANLPNLLKASTPQP